MDPQSQALWPFACARYAHWAHVGGWIELQDRYGMDINWWLWCLWQAEIQGTSPGQFDWQRLARASRIWQTQLLIPLRRLRRRVKPLSHSSSGAGLYQALKDLELAAERRQLDWLASQRPRPARATDPQTHAEKRLLWLGHFSAAYGRAQAELAQALQPRL